MSLANDIEPQPEHYGISKKSIPTWTTKDGRKLNIKDIPIEHLLNINSKFPSNTNIRNEVLRRGYVPKSNS